MTSLLANGFSSMGAADNRPSPFEGGVGETRPVHFTSDPIGGFAGFAGPFPVHNRNHIHVPSRITRPSEIVTNGMGIYPFEWAYRTIPPAESAKRLSPATSLEPHGNRALPITCGPMIGIGRAIILRHTADDRTVISRSDPLSRTCAKQPPIHVGPNGAMQRHLSRGVPLPRANAVVPPPGRLVLCRAAIHAGVCPRPLPPISLLPPTPCPRRRQPPPAARHFPCLARLLSFLPILPHT